MDRGDVGGKQGRADHRPLERPAGEEILVAIDRPVAHREKADEQDADEIRHDHDKVDRRAAQRSNLSNGGAVATPVLERVAATFGRLYVSNVRGIHGRMSVRREPKKANQMFRSHSPWRVRSTFLLTTND